MQGKDSKCASTRQGARASTSAARLSSRSSRSRLPGRSARQALLRVRNKRCNTNVPPQGRVGTAAAQQGHSYTATRQTAQTGQHKTRGETVAAGGTATAGRRPEAGSTARQPAVQRRLARSRRPSRKAVDPHRHHASADGGIVHGVDRQLSSLLVGEAHDAKASAQQLGKARGRGSSGEGCAPSGDSGGRGTLTKQAAEQPAAAACRAAVKRAPAAIGLRCSSKHPSAARQ